MWFAALMDIFYSGQEITHGCAPATCLQRFLSSSALPFLIDGITPILTVSGRFHRSRSAAASDPP